MAASYVDFKTSHSDLPVLLGMVDSLMTSWYTDYLRHLSLTYRTQPSPSETLHFPHPERVNIPAIAIGPAPAPPKQGPV